MDISNHGNGNPWCALMLLGIPGDWFHNQQHTYSSNDNIMNYWAMKTSFRTYYEFLMTKSGLFFHTKKIVLMSELGHNIEPCSCWQPKCFNCLNELVNIPSECISNCPFCIWSSVNWQLWLAVFFPSVTTDLISLSYIQYTIPSVGVLTYLPIYFIHFYNGYPFIPIYTYE